jgi:uncharacterized membrane protein
MSMPETLVGLTSGWAAFYADSAATRTLVTFAHVGGLLAGGGLAVATDRATLRAGRLSASEQQEHLSTLRRAHAAVIAGLVVVTISGVLMFASDVETYWASPIYWTKMAAIVLLLINGLLLRRAAATAERGTEGWPALRRAAVTSLVLWFAVTLFGVALANV